jgi:hypothetical protein
MALQILVENLSLVLQPVGKLGVATSQYVSADKKSDTDLHNRKGLQECVPELINNNNIGNGHGDSERSLVRTPRSEIDRIWPHLTVFQKVLFYVFTFASSLGNEVFYLLFYPYVFPILLLFINSGIHSCNPFLLCTSVSLFLSADTYLIAGLITLLSEWYEMPHER